MSPGIANLNNSRYKRSIMSSFNHNPAYIRGAMSLTGWAAFAAAFGQEAVVVSRS